MIINKISNELMEVFCTLNIKSDQTLVTISKKEGCEYQSNAVFKVAKLMGVSPVQVGHSIEKEYNKLENRSCNCEFVSPGFLNFISLSDTKNHYIEKFYNKEYLDYNSSKKTVIDYGGPNVAKALHVGHLRSAVLGDSIKRLRRFVGETVYGDVHLGDYGLQIGQVILGLENEKLGIGEFDIKDLERIYPMVSLLCKEDDTMLNKAREITRLLQYSDPNYFNLFKDIVRISISDIKSNYDRLDVEFDYWYGESDSFKYIDVVLEKLSSSNLLVLDDGAKIIKFEDEKVGNCLVVKSDGSYLYSTSDLATLHQRNIDFNFDEVVYVVDARQELHLKQVMSAASISGIVSNQQKLFHAKFGTMNGKDNKPFKTREGGVLKLELLFEMVREKLNSKALEGGSKLEKVDIDKLVNAVLKFSDLQNFRVTNYIFDLDRFTEFTGKTGPYICYTAVRINKIISSVGENFTKEFNVEYQNEKLDTLKVCLMNFEVAILACINEYSMHHLCEYVFNLCTAVNSFYQSQHILSLKDEKLKNYLITNLVASYNVIEKSLDILGIKIPDRM